MKYTLNRTFWLAIPCFLSLLQTVHATDAQTLLTAAGRDQGLCIVLGCGSSTRPSLPSDIAVASKMLVHGIALDTESLLRAQTEINKAGVRGRCMAEAIPVSPLPYVPDLANLVVIEDESALKTLGITTDDILKITAPGGVICKFENGQWNSQVKPRPPGMGDWMHPAGSSGGNRVSNDTLATFPAGIRWMDDIPMNFMNGGWASCRAMVTAGDRCFTLSPTEFENLDTLRSTFKTNLWLTAHDAFNGLPLWKIDCGIETKPSALNIRNPGTLSTDGPCVYTYAKDGLIVVDSANGNILRTIPVKHPCVRLVLSNGVLISVGWKETQCLGQVNGLWGAWQPKTNEGTVEAFEVKTGKLLWEKAIAPQDLLADRDTVFMLTTGTSSTSERVLEAVHLQDGTPAWKTASSEFEKDLDTSLGLAADGVVVVCHQTAGADAKKPDGSISVYASTDGHKLWELPKTSVTGIGPSIQMVLVQGHLWLNDEAYQAKTGQPMKDSKTGQPPKNLPRTGVGACVPSTVVDDGRIFINGRGMTVSSRNTSAGADATYGQQFSFKALRAHCVQGIVPANGMFYVAQNNCCCTPDCLPGVIGFGPVSTLPVETDFQAVRPLEKGPAYTTAMSETDPVGEWPMFLQDEKRSSISTGELPEQLSILWQQPVASELSGPLANAWASRLRSTLTAPVTMDNVVVVAAIEEGRVFALNAADGNVLWNFDVGARVESAPTLYHGRCFFGSRNGWLYALDLATGKLAWRLRVAPLERRLVAFGQVESVWPALGSVLVHQGMVYATAGLNSETDGGLAVIAADVKSGKQIWSRQIGEGFVRSNDLLQFQDGQIALRDYSFNPQTGEGTMPVREKGVGVGGLEGLMDEGWTKVYQRRSGNLRYNSKIASHLLASNSDTVFALDYAMKKEIAETLSTDKPPAESFLWKKGPSELKPQALALTSNAVVYAGKIPGKEKVDGYVQLIKMSDGTGISQVTLPAPVIHQGIAIARGQIFVSLSNGSILCLGRTR